MEVVQQPIQQNIISEQQVELQPISTNGAAVEPKSNVYTYVVYGVMAIVLIVLIYFAYAKFMESAGGQSCDDAKKSDSASLVPDYNLRDELKAIDKAQAAILKRISSDVGL